jgi:maleate isomerase
LLVPSSNSVLEPALYRRLPRWAALHAARLFVTESSAAGLRGIHSAIPDAAKLVATVQPHLIIVGCTSVSGLDDGALERRMVPQLEATTGAPVITVLPSVIAKLRALHCRRVVLVTPHGADVDAVLVRGLKAAGLAVPEIHSIGIRENFALGRVSPAEIVRFVADRVQRPLGQTDGLFLSCTNFRSVDAEPLLRRRYGLRVVSSVGVLIEQTLTRLGQLRTGGTTRGSRRFGSGKRRAHGA